MQDNQGVESSTSIRMGRNKSTSKSPASSSQFGSLRLDFQFAKSLAASAYRNLRIPTHQVSIASWTISGRSPVWSITRARPNSGSISNTPGAQFAQFLHPGGMDECNRSIKGPLLSVSPRAQIKQLSTTNAAAADIYQESG